MGAGAVVVVLPGTVAPGLGAVDWPETFAGGSGCKVLRGVCKGMSFDGVCNGLSGGREVEEAVL